MSKFTQVIVIYNPNSTGDSQANAERFAKTLGTKNTDIDVQTIATKYAVHAFEIARDNAAEPSTLIVSSSGDGGYNEVINGVLDSKGKAATAVLPSGNANDHHASTASGDLIGNVLSSTAKPIEIIEVTAMVNGRQWHRYAHSYVGFGVTPKVGRVLTKQRPNALTEKWYVLSHAFKFRHVTLKINQQKRRYTSLVFATIGRMSKVMKLDSDASLRDGKMEVYETDYVSVFGLLRLFFNASTTGLNHSSKTDAFTLRTVRPTLVQLDGEVCLWRSNCLEV